jgi:GDP-L-fucose synthase
VNSDTKIYVAGHTGLAGSAIVRRLRALGCANPITRSHRELDLRDQRQVEQFFDVERPQIVFLAAARVGGIHANSARPAEFIGQNLLIQTHVIDACHRYGTRKLVFLGSSCIYPRLARQPMDEAQLLTGPLEPTNEWYAIAKIAGLKMCQAYRRQFGLDAITLMPTNLYGPGDNFSREDSHVLPALIRRFHDARVAKLPTVELWGSGTPRREFLHADDFADAAVFLMERYSDEAPINVGRGDDVTILELARTIREVVGFEGELVFDRSKPDGAPRKLLDISRLRALGWSTRIELREGIEQTYRWFTEHYAEARL